MRAITMNDVADSVESLKERREQTRHRRPQRPTIRDVSRLAGVSHMTVSRVLSDPALVLPATRERVVKAIADLGYVPDKGAGSLSSRRTRFIGLILPTLTNTNFAAIAHGLSEELKEVGYHLLIAYTDYDLDEEERQLSNLLARRPEAILVAGTTHRRASAKLLLMADVPVIELSDLASRPIQHAVGFSNYRAGQEAARHLIARGFTRIGAIASEVDPDRGDHRGEERIRGFAEELCAHGIGVENILRHGNVPVSFDHGAAAIGILLAREPRLQAVFAVSDLSAVGVVMECQRRGIDVPEQLSVLGFGDFEIGRVINPALTTIHVDFHRLGRRAGMLLRELLSDDAKDDARIIDLGVTLIERASVGTISS